MIERIVSLPYVETIFSSPDEKSRWFAINGKKIFITGGTGFFGKWWLSCYLYARENLGIKADITILSRSPDSFIEKFPECNIEDISWCIGDIRNFTLPEIDFDYILHMAKNYASAALNDPISEFYSIVLGTRRILEVANQCTNSTLLFVSSGAVYGKHTCALSEDHLSKTDPLNTDNGYSVGKLAAEQLCSLYHRQYGVNVKVARCFTFLGPFLPLDEHYAAGNFIQSIIEGDDIVIKSDGSAIRSYMYPSDLINWIMAVMIEGKAVTPYNVGSPHSINIRDLAKVMVDVSGKDVQCKILGKATANNDRHIYIPDTAFTEKTFDVKNKINLEQIIQATINWNVQ